MTPRNQRMLIVGIGGLGGPAAWALAESKVGLLGLCDDDRVERANLHRQILFEDRDVGKPKVEVASRALQARAPWLQVKIHSNRMVPDNAIALVRDYDVVLEGSDNFATKFLAADACALAGVPIVHASAVRWIGTVLAVGATGRPCYRCLFEDVPHQGVANCDEAGVMGPVVGIVAALQVELALALAAAEPVAGEVVTYDGRSDELRRWTLRPRAECPLCSAACRISRIDAKTYASPACAG